MDKSHVELQYIGQGNLIVKAISAEAKELLRDKENRDFYHNNLDMLIDNFMIERGYKEKI